ncbi:hypothetical protein [Caniella muris]|uniref:hypothetical protein n=1 Tax=Caniella muris TaxID=2941502 RepID=UPI00203B42C0|nr:hypothetical protein [Caniella muris]
MMSKLRLWWDEGYISWESLVVAAVCVGLGVLYYGFGIISHSALVLLSGLNVVAVFLFDWYDERKRGRTFDAGVSLLFVLLSLLFL